KDSDLSEEVTEDTEGANNNDTNTNTEEEEGSQQTENQGDYDVYIGGEVVETDDKIVIDGESNLIPGSRVVGEVSVGKNVRYFLNPSVKDYDFLADTSEIVDDQGNFHMEIDHPGLEN